MIDHKRLIRVFPRVTNATPRDALARYAEPDMWDEADEVHVSVAFDEDRAKAEGLAREWEYVTSRVLIGGPAYDDPGGEFAPGRYLKPGYTITSRGCPNHCWFCEAWRNEGGIRELPIRDGFNLLDNNILACSRDHVEAVFAMLERQRQRPLLTGGLEAARLEDWHVERLMRLRPKTMWFAYDTPDDYEPLLMASLKLRVAGFLGRAHETGCYVLIGYNRMGHRDTLEHARRRCDEVIELGYMPQAMLYNDGCDWDSESEQKAWRALRWEYSNRVIVGSKMKGGGQ